MNTSIPCHHEYVHLRGSVLSLLTIIVGLATAGNVDAAVNAVIDFYIMRLVPWPLDQVLLAETLAELFVSHAITIGVGLLFATSNWRKNV